MHVPSVSSDAASSQPRRLLAGAAWAALLSIFPVLAADPAALFAQANTSRSAPVAAVSQVAGQVLDPSGSPISGARILDPSGKLLGLTDNSGRLAVPCGNPCPASLPVTVQASGFATTRALWQSAAPVTLRISNQDSVTVTAYRAPLGNLESPVSTRLLSSTDLQQVAPITLDGQLRQVAGVETFRRSSSLVANPSSQGLSLRGLGSTSASRTLVTQDDVPLNDAFGGWIHWQELPELSIHSIEVVRGGASDLYGSSAIGGVVNVLPLRPTSNLFELHSSFGSLNTYDDSMLFSGHRGHWGALATGGALGTNGFIQTTPASRGSVDINSNVHSQNGLFLLDHTQGSLRTFARFSGFNEARSNGTPLQTNGTRLWRYSLGSDWNTPASGQLAFRAYGSTDHYRQTFSTISTSRNFESLNRFALTPDNELGAVLHYSQPIARFGPGFLFLAGADTHDVRALDQEITLKSGVPGYINLSDRQRQTGLYAEALYTHNAWTASASGRFDWFSNFDGYRQQPTQAPLSHLTERVFDPRLGVSRKLGTHFALSGSGFRAYRAPTPSELYRSTQVGSLLTLPNNDLRSERATGFETGFATEYGWGTTRTSYFWTRVNRPISALTIDTTSNPIKLQRENLGQIESRGLSTEFELRPPDTSWLTLNGGYQYADATVTQNNQASNLVGNWIPQVAHHSATAQLRAYKPRIGTASVQARLSGKQYDDDANRYLLHGYSKFDIYLSHNFGPRLELFSATENLLNRQIEVGRTPTLTLSAPRTIRGGLNIKLTPESK